MEKLRRSQRTTKGVAAPKLGYTDTQSYAGASGGDDHDDRMTESRSQAVTANSADRLSARIAVLQAEQAVAEKRLEIARLMAWLPLSVILSSPPLAPA